MIRHSISLRPEFFLFVDLREIFSGLGSGGRKKKENSSEAQRSFSFSELFFSFFYIFRTNSKLVCIKS